MSARTRSEAKNHLEATQRLASAIRDRLAPVFEAHVDLFFDYEKSAVDRLIAKAREVEAGYAASGERRRRKKDDFPDYLLRSLRYLPAFKDGDGEGRGDVIRVGDYLHVASPNLEQIRDDVTRQVRIIHSNYINRNVSKIAIIVAVRKERPGMEFEDFRINAVRVAGRSLEGTADYWFVNGDRFTTESSIISNRTSIDSADWYNQYPTRFCAITLAGAASASQSEAWMAHVFGRGESEADFAKRLSEGRDAEDLPHFSAEGSPLLPAAEAKDFIKAVRERRKHLHKNLVKAMKAKLKERRVLTQIAAAEIERAYEVVNDTPKVSETSEAVRDGYLASFASAEALIADDGSFEPVEALAADLAADPDQLMRSRMIDELWHAKAPEVMVLRAPMFWTAASAAARALVADLVISAMHRELGTDYRISAYLKGLAMRSGDSWPSPRGLEPKSFAQALDRLDQATSESIWPRLREVLLRIASQPDRMAEDLADDILRRDAASDGGAKLLASPRARIVAVAAAYAHEDCDKIREVAGEGGLSAAMRRLSAIGFDGYRMREMFLGCTTPQVFEAAFRQERVVFDLGSAAYWRLREEGA